MPTIQSEMDPTRSASEAVNPTAPATGSSTTTLFMLLAAFGATAWMAARGFVPEGMLQTAMVVIFAASPPLLAFFLASRTAKRKDIPRSEKRTWMLVSLGSAAAGISTILNLLAHSLASNQEIITPISSALYFASAALMLVGMTGWIQRMGPTAWFWTILDLLIVGLVGGIVIWTGELGSSLINPSSNSAVDSANIALYPITSIILLVGAVTILSQLGRREVRGSEVMATFGVVFMVASNLLLASESAATGSYAKGYFLLLTGKATHTFQIADLGWVIGYLLIAAAASRHRIKHSFDNDLPLVERSATWEVMWLLTPFTLLIAVTSAWHLNADSANSLENIIYGALSVVLVLRCAASAAMNQHFARAAIIDPVTSTYTPRLFKKRLNEALEISVSTKKPISLMIFDVDDFEVILDTYGHVVGDRIMQEIARILRRECDERYILFRSASDEFAVVMPNADVELATSLADRIRAHVHDLRLGDDGNITVTGGIASAPIHCRTTKELIHLTRGALYWGKLNGTDHFTAYDPDVVQVLNENERSKMVDQTARLRAVLALARALDARDAYTAQHSQNVARYALAIATQMGWKLDQQELLRTAGLLHDVGKIGVRDSTLRKTSRLTDEEFEEMKRHPMMSAQVVEGVAPDSILPWIESHHERWDGKGYPHGLAGDAIPLGARILAVADTFDAMTSSRSYRPALPVTWAIHEITKCAGNQFDVEVVRAFLKAIAIGTIEAERAPQVIQEQELGSITYDQIDPEFSAVETTGEIDMPKAA